MAKSLYYYYDIIFWTNYAFYLLYLAIRVISFFLLYLLEIANKNKDSCIAPIAKITKPMRWLILNLFGGPLGILERLDKYEEDDIDDNDIPTLHICKKKISYGSIMLLFMLIVGFGILALSSASNLALIQVTHICSEDPDIDCYPQLIRGANETIIDLYNNYYD